MACSSDSSTQNSSEPPRRATIADVERGIRDYIKREAAENDGYFLLQNDSTDLSLRLVRVHTEYLSVLSKGQYFACVDLADEKGDVYDVDFFLAGNSEQMKVTETTVHKLNGKPFYAWKQNEDKPNIKGKNMGDYWNEDIARTSVANQKLDIEGEHPAPFPEEIITLPVLQTSKEFELVLDPFMGSGTTGRVCDKLKRRFVVYDLKGY